MIYRLEMVYRLSTVKLPEGVIAHIHMLSWLWITWYPIASSSPHGIQKPFRSVKAQENYDVSAEFSSLYPRSGWFVRWGKTNTVMIWVFRMRNNRNYICWVGCWYFANPGHVNIMFPWFSRIRWREPSTGNLLNFSWNNSIEHYPLVNWNRPWEEPIASRNSSFNPCLAGSMLIFKKCTLVVQLHHTSYSLEIQHNYWTRP